MGGFCPVYLDGRHRLAATVEDACACGAELGLSGRRRRDRGVTRSDVLEGLCGGVAGGLSGDGRSSGARGSTLRFEVDEDRGGHCDGQAYPRGELESFVLDVVDDDDRRAEPGDEPGDDLLV